MASNKSKPVNSSPETAFFEAIFSAIFQLLKWIVGLFLGRLGKTTGKKTTLRVELEQLREHWETVELQVMQEITRAQAISEADKIFDSALKSYQIPGETMAERLKASQSRFSQDTYQQIWEAHKLRNTLAHEVGVKVSSKEAQAAVAGFRAGLYQLKVLR